MPNCYKMQAQEWNWWLQRYAWSKEWSQILLSDQWLADLLCDTLDEIQSALNYLHIYTCVQHVYCVCCTTTYFPHLQFHFHRIENQEWSARIHLPRDHTTAHTHMCWSNSFCIVSISISFNKAISIHLRCIFVNCNAKMVWTINDCGRWKIRRKCANKQIIERNKCLCYSLWIRIFRGKNALNSFAWRCNSISLCCKIH